MTMVDATVGKRVLHHLRAVYDDALEMMRTSEQSFIAARDQLDTEMIAQYKAELDALGITIGSTPVIRDGRSKIEHGRHVAALAAIDAAIRRADTDAALDELHDAYKVASDECAKSRRAMERA